jgi:hypothetical protein
VTASTPPLGTPQACSPAGQDAADATKVCHPHGTTATAPTS